MLGIISSIRTQLLRCSTHQLALDAFTANPNSVRPVRDGVFDWADRGAVWEWCEVQFGALGGAVSIDAETVSTCS